MYIDLKKSMALLMKTDKDIFMNIEYPKIPA